MYNRKKIFWSACVGIFFFGIAITTLGSLVPQLKQRFGLDDMGIGILFSILPIGILIGSLVFGPVCDRYGYKILLTTACFSMAVGFMGIAYSPVLYLLKVSIFLFGLGGGAINGATSALVSDVSEANKGANLSILGVFFAIGALGMPFILGSIEAILPYTTILFIISIATALTGILYLIIRFPQAKQGEGVSIRQALTLLKDPLLLLISGFLFLQSAFEGILNNWSPTYLSGYLDIPREKALFALTMGVAGMTAMRLFLGSVFRKTSAVSIWTITLSAMGLGLTLLLIGKTYYPAAAGFVLIGIGLAAGFPIMLGYVGDIFKDLSGTAFSIAFTIALLGNTVINYLIGVIAEAYGIRYLVFTGIAEWVLMTVLCVMILRRRVRYIH